MTHINLEMELLNLDGSVIPDDKGKPTTLKTVFCNVLVNQAAGVKVTGVENAHRFNLAMQIYNADEIELSHDNVTLIRDLVAEGYIPLVAGQVWNILDPPVEDTPSATEEQLPETIPPTEPGII